MAEFETYLVTYDLGTDTGKDYFDAGHAIRGHYDCVDLQKSVWVIHTADTGSAVVDKIASCLPKGTRYFVSVIHEYVHLPDPTHEGWLHHKRISKGFPITDRCRE